MGVSATVDSTYLVSIPATLSMQKKSGTTFEGTYVVKAMGNITDSQYVSIVPTTEDGKVSLVNESIPGVTIDATVTQEVTKFSNSAGSSDTVTIQSDAFTGATGKVSVTIKKAGSYKGTISFVYGLY